jgi:hypothetical protein
MLPAPRALRRRPARSPQATRLAPPPPAATPAAVQAAWARGAVAPGPARCPTCAAAIRRTYCPVCGERRRDARRFRVADVLARAVEATLDLDGRALRTTRTLVTAPGALTSHFMAGRWKPFLRPLQLFVLVNVVFFVWAGSPYGVNTFTTPLRIHVTSKTFPHKALAARWVDERVAKRATTFEAYAETFDRQVETLSRSLIFLLLPGLALVFGLLHPRRLVAHHLVAACHFLAFALLALIMVVSVLVVVALSLGFFDPAIQEIVLSLTFLILFTVYGTGLLRRAYGDGWLRAVLGGVALSVSLIPLVMAYRAVLFFLVFAVT